MMTRRKNITAKLHSRRGISMVMAMVAFLVVTMVAMVIVTAALTAVKTVKNDEDTRQNMLYLTSAGKFLKSELCENTASNFVSLEETCTATKQATVTRTYRNTNRRGNIITGYYYDDDEYVEYGEAVVTWSDTIGTVTPKSGVTPSYDDSGLCKSAGFMDDFRELYASDSTEIRKEGSFTISVAPPAGAEDGAKDVVVTYVMFPKEYYNEGELITNKPYRVVFTLTVEDTGESMFMDAFATIIEGTTVLSSTIPESTGTETWVRDTEATEYYTGNWLNRQYYKEYKKIYSRIDTFPATRTSKVTWNNFLTYYNIEGSTN